MTKPTKPLFANPETTRDIRQKAMDWAKETLKARGVTYPSYDPKLTPDEHYANIRAYSDQESALVVEFMRMPSGPRPLELDNVLPKPKGWNAYHDK